MDLAHIINGLALFAAISGEQMLTALIWLVGIGLAFWLLWWLLGYIGLPEPFNKVARVILGLVAVVILIRFIFKILGNPEF